MRGSQEDMGKTLVNLGASRTNSVSIYSEKTQDIWIVSAKKKTMKLWWEGNKNL